MTAVKFEQLEHISNNFMCTGECTHISYVDIDN